MGEDRNIAVGAGERARGQLAGGDAPAELVVPGQFLDLAVRGHWIPV
jgi:hypothetical protein